MKIAILSRDGTLWSCKRLRDAAIKRGHLVEILDPLSCYMNISPAASSIHYKGRQLPFFDAVIPRIGSAITFYGTAALRQFEILGSYPLNESVAITRARDKLRSLQLLARQGIDQATNRPYTSRYIGSLVADFHRNLLKGGIYLYPSTASHPQGKLRLLYEGNPMAFLAEQAGGKASDGKERILDIVPESLHQRRPFFVGNEHMVDDVERFMREYPDA